MAYEPTLDDVLNSLYGPEGGLTEEELAQYMPEPYVAPEYTPSEIPQSGYAPQGRNVAQGDVKLGGPRTPYDDLIYQKAVAAGQDPNLIKAQIWAESTFNPKAVSPVGAQGLTQFMPGTWRKYGKGSPFDPNAAIDAQLAYNADLLQRFGGDERKVLAAYNWGEHRKSYALPDWERHAPAETRDYVKKILAKRDQYAGTANRSYPVTAQEQAQPQESPFDIVKLSDGSAVEVEKGTDLASVAEILKKNGVQAEPIKNVALPNGSYVEAPYSYSDDQVFDIVRKSKPELFGEQPEDKKRGYGAAAKSSFEAGIGSALTGLGGLGTYAGEKIESPLARQAGEYLTDKGKEWQKMGEEAYQELTPEEAKAMGFEGQFRKYVGEPAAGFVGSMGAALPALALPGGAATRIGAFATQELGGQLAEQERMGQEPNVEKALPYAVGSGIVQNSLLGPLKYVTKAFGKPDVLAKIAEITEKEGADAAKQYAGGVMKNILKETGVNTGEVVVSEVISRAAERAASGQPLDTPDAIAEYEDIAIKSAPGGLLGIPGAYGVHAAKQGTIEEVQLAEQQKVQAERVAEEQKAAEEQAAIENEKQAAAEAELERQAGIGVEAAPISEPTVRGKENVAPTEPPLVAEESLPPVEPAGVVAPPAVEVAPEAVQAAPEVKAEIPEPTVRGKEPKVPEAVAPETTNPADILGLNNRSGLRKQLQGLDVTKVEDHPKIEGILQKTSATFSAENLANLETKMKEVQSANGIQIPATPDVSSITQPQIRKEGQGAPVSSEGVRSGGQEIGAVKIPEDETVDRPDYWRENPEAPEDKASWQDTFGAIHHDTDYTLPSGTKVVGVVNSGQGGTIALRMKTPEGKEKFWSVSPDNTGAMRWRSSIGGEPVTEAALRKNLGDSLYEKLYTLDGIKVDSAKSFNKVADRVVNAVRKVLPLQSTKVVDEQGKPKPMYHGTGNIIKAFDKEGLGTHFTSDPEVASKFAASFEEGSNVHRVFLDIKNPLRVKDFGGSHSNATEVAKDFVKQGVLPKGYVNDAFYDRIMEGVQGEESTSIYESNNAKELSRIRKVIEEQGYDGLVYTNRVEGGGDTYVAFKPEQVVQSSETKKLPQAEVTLPPEAKEVPKVTPVAEARQTPVSVEKLPTPAEAWESLRTPEQPAFESLSKDTQKLWKDEYKASEGIVGKSAIDDLVKGERLYTKSVVGEKPKGEIRIKKEKFDAIYDRYVRSDEKVEAGIGRIDPDAFLKATTSATEEARIKQEIEQYGPPDFNQRTPIELTIDEQGNIVDHEGRHRMMVLRDKGVRQVPVIVKRRSSSDVPLQKRLSPQKTGGNRGRDEAFVYGLEPIHYNNRAKLEEVFGERPQPAKGEGVKRPTTDTIGNEGEFDVSKMDIREAKASNPDRGIRPVKVEDYSDVTNTRDLIKRYKEKGTDPELLKLADTLNVSPHLGALPVEWVKQGDKPHPDVIAAFNKGATAMVAWGEKTGPKMYIRADAPLREDVIVHEAVHGVTQAALERNPEGAKELSGLTKQIGRSLSDQAAEGKGWKSEEIRDFWREVVKDDPGELLAYGLTSPTFREVLSQYGADGKPFTAYRTEAELNALRKGQEKPAKVFTAQAPKELTLWDKFVDAVAKLFGLPTSRKAEFKRQLEEYLDKKATYEQKVKDYNTLRPLQERLDSAFKEALKETSKKGIDFEGTTVKEVKEETARTTPLVKETEADSSLKRGMNAAVNAFKGNVWTRLETNYVNRHAALANAIKDKATVDSNGKYRADLVGSANDQIFNVISAGITDGVPVFSRAGTVMVQKDAKENLSNIAKRIDKVAVKNPRVFVGEIARALRGESLKKEDAEAIKQIDILEDKAKKLKAYAKSQTFAEGKKADTLANRYLAEAKKLKDRVGEEGREKLVTDEDILEAKRRLAEHPEIQKILDDVHGLMNSLVDLWEASGLVSKDVANEWRSKPSYIPLYMSQEDILNDPSRVVRMMGGGAKSLPNVKTLKGGTHAINLLENLQKHYAFMTSAAAQNSSRKAAARDLELFGAAQRTSPDDKNAIMFKENGKEIYYKISDPLMFEAFQAAAPLTNPLLKAAREYTKAFRAVTLVNPLYWYRQLIRDPIHANVVSQTGMVTPIGATISFAKIIAGASPEYAELRRRGVVGAVDSLTDPARFKKIYDKGPHLFKKGADWVMHVHEAADAATRVEVYKAAIKDAKKKGMSREQAKDYATMRAREIINFANQGRSETLQAIRATVPFFSAALNSLDSVARAATGKGLNRREAAEARRLFTSRMLMIASFTTAYALAMQDDEDYLKSPDSINNWLIPTGDKENPFIMIPLPFELGFVGKVIPELIVRLNSGTLTAYEGKKALKEAAGATLTPPLPFPQVIKPIVEAAINYDLHQGRPIVSPSEQGKLPEEQTKGASALSIEVGRKLGLSPAQIEHFGRGYMTELWTAVGVLSDAFLPAGQYKETKNIAEIPTLLGGAKGILNKPDRERDMDIFYELSNGAQQIKRSVSAAQGKGDVDAMERIMADPEKKKRFYASDVGRNIGEEISEVNKAIEQIRNDKSITDPKKKQEMIRERQQYKNQLATQGKEWFYSLGVNEP